MSTKERWARLKTPEVLFALLFVLLNIGWWVRMFTLPPSGRSDKWAIGYQLGTYPISLPLAVIGDWLNIDFFNLPPLAWFLRSTASQSENYYRFIVPGILGWGGLGYAFGWGISTLKGVLTRRFGRPRAGA